MARKFSPQIITANDLFEGDVIYLTAKGTWSRRIEYAHIAHSPEQVETMLSVAQNQPGSVVGAYAVDVKIDDGGNASPAHFREDFRRQGPSNYFHGKQAETDKTNQGAGA